MEYCRGFFYDVLSLEINEAILKVSGILCCNRIVANNIPSSHSLVKGSHRLGKGSHKLGKGLKG